MPTTEKRDRAQSADGVSCSREGLEFMGMEFQPGLRENEPYPSTFSPVLSVK